MRCKQHQACQNNKSGNSSQCDPLKERGSSVCRQCCNDRTDKCNLDLYKWILTDGSQQTAWDKEHIMHHTLPPTSEPVVIPKTQLWNMEWVSVNDSRAIAQKLKEDELASQQGSEASSSSSSSSSSFSSSTSSTIGK